MSKNILHPKACNINVLLVSTGYTRWKGDWSHIFLHRLSISLSKKGIEIHIIAPHSKGLQEEEVYNGIFIHRFRYFYPDSIQTLAYSPGVPENLKTFKGKILLPFFMLCMLKKIIHIAVKYNIDLIYAHWIIPTGFVAVLAKKIIRKPLITRIYSAELNPLFKKNNFINKIAKILVKYTMINTDELVGNSPATCNSGKKIYRYKKIDVLPDGVDIDIFNPKVKGEEIKNKYGLNNNIIFTTGRMVERKGFMYLIESMPYILNNFPNTILILGGNGPEKENLINLVKTLQIQKNVFFSGFINNEDLPKYMKACDVFVLPSIIDKNGDTEGLGLVLLESMSCGTPVIGTNVGGIPYAIKNFGFIVEQKNPKEIANKIEILFKNKDLKRKIGEIGRKYIEENFSLDIIAEKHLTKFKELIALTRCARAQPIEFNLQFARETSS